MIIKLSSNTYNRLVALLTEHVCDTKHEIAWENSKVITTNNRYGQRLCLEAWHINMSNYASHWQVTTTIITIIVYLYLNRIYMVKLQLLKIK